MRGWRLVLVVLGGVALAALVLRALPPIVVLLGSAGAAIYGGDRYKKRKRAERERTEARSLGLERAADDRFGLSTLPLQFLARGGERRVIENVLFGAWRGLDVKVFDVRLPPSDGPDERGFACALIPLESNVPSLVVEPRTFFTPAEERGQLPSVEIGHDGFGDAFDVRSDEPAFAREVLGEETRAWLAGLDDDIGFELHARMLLSYMPGGRHDSLSLLQASMDFATHLPSKPTPRRVKGAKKARTVVAKPKKAPVPSTTRRPRKPHPSV